jgi:hypothetical protein
MSQRPQRQQRPKAGQRHPSAHVQDDQRPKPLGPRSEPGILGSQAAPQRPAELGSWNWTLCDEAPCQIPIGRIQMGVDVGGLGQRRKIGEWGLSARASRYAVTASRGSPASASIRDNTSQACQFCGSSTVAVRAALAAAGSWPALSRTSASWIRADTARGSTARAERVAASAAEF